MKIQVIVGSSRPGRASERVAKWVMAAAAHRTEFETELVDLADYDLPHFDEPVSPKYNPDRPMNAVTKRWVAKVGEADGYVIITPEYNHSISGHLKDALDYLDWQFTKKPVAIVGYGGAGGARSVEQLKLIVSFLGAAVVPETVGLVGPDRGLIDETGKWVSKDTGPYAGPAKLEQVLDDLNWWASTLLAGRAAAKL